MRAHASGLSVEQAREFKAHIRAGIATPQEKAAFARWKARVRSTFTPFTRDIFKRVARSCETRQHDRPAGRASERPRERGEARSRATSTSSSAPSGDPPSDEPPGGRPRLCKNPAHGKFGGGHLDRLGLPEGTEYCHVNCKQQAYGIRRGAKPKRLASPPPGWRREPGTAAFCACETHRPLIDWPDPHRWPEPSCVICGRRVAIPDLVFELEVSVLVLARSLRWAKERTPKSHVPGQPAFSSQSYVTAPRQVRGGGPSTAPNDPPIPEVSPALEDDEPSDQQLRAIEREDVAA
jgi:hypothetical protein